MKVYRCRWCGRRVWGIFGWFHQPARCSEKPDVPDWSLLYEESS